MRRPIILLGSNDPTINQEIFRRISSHTHTHTNDTNAKCGGVIKATIYYDDMKNAVEHRESRLTTPSWPHETRFLVCKHFHRKYVGWDINGKGKNVR